MSNLNFTPAQVCSRCANQYSVDADTTSCRRCEQMEELHPLLPQYIEDCINRAVVAHDKLRDRLEDLEQTNI